jgi:putative membrane protein
LQTTNRINGIHYLVRAALLLGFATFIIYLVKTDSLIYYIAPRMNSYVKLSSFAFYIMALYQFYLGIQSLWGVRAACDCDHPPSKSILRSTVVYSIFIMPLMLGFLLPNVAMSSAIAEKKGMNLAIGTTKAPSNASQLDPNSTQTHLVQNALVLGTEYRPDPRTGQVLEPVSASINTKLPAAGKKVTSEQLAQMFAPPDVYYDDFSKMGMIMYQEDVIHVRPEIFTEMLTSIDLYKQNFVGKKIEISGFVYREDDMKPNQFVVGRFAVTCCSADASPYGVLVEFPSAGSFVKDTWIKVSGTIELTKYHDNNIMKLHAAAIEKISAPESPYVYSNSDPLAELNLTDKK